MLMMKIVASFEENVSNSRPEFKIHTLFGTQNGQNWYPLTRSAEKSYPALGPGRTYLWLAFGTTHFRECYRSNQIPLDSMVLALLPFCFISFTAMNNNILTDQINCTFINLSIHTLRSGVLFLGTRSQLMSVRVQSDVSWRVAVLVKSLHTKFSLFRRYFTICKKLFSAKFYSLAKIYPILLGWQMIT